MTTPAPTPSSTDAFLPAPITGASTTFAAVYGVPKDTVALAMLNILGGLVSASTKLRFAGTFHPLGVHMALIDAGARESEPLEAELIAPLLDEVQRLKDLQAQNPQARKQFDQQVKYQDTLPQGSPEALASMATIRELASILGPDLLQVGTPVSGRSDGLGAPVLMPMLDELIATGKDGPIRALIQSFAGDPGTTATILGSISFNAARGLINSPLVQSSAGWPLMVLPKHGSPFIEVGDCAIEQARVQWRDLVNQALRNRYRSVRALFLSAPAMLVVEEVKQDAERRAFQPGNNVAFLWMVSALIRLGATVHILGDADEDQITAESLNAVKPLILRAADMQKSLFPGRSINWRKRRIPARAITAGDHEKVRKVILRNPNASDRKIRRMLPNRTAGYWTFLIHAARENLALGIAAKSAATAAATDTAKTDLKK